VKTPPLKQADVTREWRRRIKDEFDRAGIEFATKSVVTLEPGRELR
jgi:small-conductance mechanosensitive channel